MENKFDINQFVNVITEKSILVDLVDRVKLRRKERGITQRDLVKRSGVSYASIRRFETTGEISLSSLLKIAKVLNALSDFNSLFAEEYVGNLKDY